MDILLISLLLFGFAISSTSCDSREKSSGERGGCRICPSLTTNECPLISSCSICTQTSIQEIDSSNECLEVSVSCSEGSRVILELHNGETVSRKASTLGKFSCQRSGLWKVKGVGYTEKHVKSVTCYTASTGRQNSPITLDSNKAILDNTLANFEVEYARHDGDSLTWGGNETTFVIKTSQPFTRSKFFATQTDGITYNLYQMHAHWGHPGTNGSEHTVDGQRYMAEFHFVHYDPEYGHFDNAVGKENGIAVIGVLAELGNHNDELDKILSEISKFDGLIELSDFEHHVNKVRFDYRKLFSAEKQFFTYMGSLTTGDYNTCVHWTVMRTPITISQEQMDILYAFNQDNFRELQPILSNTEIRKNFA